MFRPRLDSILYAASTLIKQETLMSPIRGVLLDPSSRLPKHMWNASLMRLNHRFFLPSPYCLLKGSLNNY